MKVYDNNGILDTGSGTRLKSMEPQRFYTDDRPLQRRLYRAHS